jgi:hypothetical protein
MGPRCAALNELPVRSGSEVGTAISIVKGAFRLQPRRHIAATWRAWPRLDSKVGRSDNAARWK